MKLSKKSEKLLKELIEIRFVKSKYFQVNWAKDHIKFMKGRR